MHQRGASGRSRANGRSLSAVSRDTVEAVRSRFAALLPLSKLDRQRPRTTRAGPDGPDGPGLRDPSARRTLPPPPAHSLDVHQRRASAQVARGGTGGGGGYPISPTPGEVGPSGPSGPAPTGRGLWPVQVRPRIWTTWTISTGRVLGVRPPSNPLRPSPSARGFPSKTLAPSRPLCYNSGCRAEQPKPKNRGAP